MSTPFSHWQVLPHGKLTTVEENIRTVVGEIPMPLADIPRRLTIVRLRDGRLVIFNVVALAEDDMRSLERFGTPAFLVVPNAHHRLDAKIWKDRYPNPEVIAPPGHAPRSKKPFPSQSRGSISTILMWRS
jgi:hypothetical protein